MMDLFERYGIALVFANVLVEQIGVPIPAVPTLIVAGALAAEGQLSAPAVFAAAVAASIVGDSLWFAAGRFYGRRVLRLLCRVSLSPDSCVRQTQDQFERWGNATLVLGKFIPGLSTVAPPLAGAMHLSWQRFLLMNSVGLALWAGIAIGAGMLFHSQVEDLLARLEVLGRQAVIAGLSALAAYIALKWWERQRFYKAMRVARITVGELRDLSRAEQKPVVVDLRSLAGAGQDRRSIPGAIALNLSQLDRALERLPADRPIIFFCDCPNEATAAAAAKNLIDLGYKNVRPLLGGLDAWVDAGYELEELRDLPK